MSQPFSDLSFDQDLHLLMSVAILSSQHGACVPLRPVFDTWSKAYPDDALGRVGEGLALVGEGKVEDGYALIRKAAKTSRTRADQAHDVLKTLDASLEDAEA